MNLIIDATNIKSGGGLNSGLTLEATSASQYGTIDFKTYQGLAGQFLSAGSAFSNAIFTPNSTSFANYLPTGNVQLVAGGASGQILFATGGFALANERMRIDAAGNVGIGCSTPSSKLHVNGTISTTAMSVATSIACSSDKRFKKNISPLQNSLEKVLNLQGVNYDWKINEFPDKHFNEGQQIGFIAQEIEEILPLVVQTDADGYKAVDYSRLTPVLVEAVKEQQAIIAAQQAEITALQKQVASLEELKSQVAALTQLVMKQNDTNSNKAQVGDE